MQSSSVFEDNIFTTSKILSTISCLKTLPLLFFFWFNQHTFCKVTSVRSSSQKQIFGIHGMGFFYKLDTFSITQPCKSTKDIYRFKVLSFYTWIAQKSQEKEHRYTTLIKSNTTIITFHMRHSRGKMYIGHDQHCVCLSLATFSHYCMDPDVTCGSDRGTL